MSTIQGTAGNVTAAGFNAKFQSWSATFEGREFNTTGFGDAGWITAKIINGRCTGNAIGVISEDVPVPTESLGEADEFVTATFEGAVQLTFASGKTWTFDALITAVAIDRAEEGAGSSVYRLTFASTGKITQAWAA